MEEKRETIISKESGYDQKAFLQIRLHEIIQRYDRASMNPLFYNADIGTYNYQIMQQCLVSIFQTIFSKLKPDEKDAGKKKREESETTILLPVYNRQRNSDRTLFSPDNWKKINDCLFEFRCLMEEFMDGHGFNPSKDDVGKSIIKF